MLRSLSPEKHLNGWLLIHRLVSITPILRRFVAYRGALLARNQLDNMSPRGSDCSHLWPCLTRSGKLGRVLGSGLAAAQGLRELLQEQQAQECENHPLLRPLVPELPLQAAKLD
jgi:hypothetical protein